MKIEKSETVLAHPALRILPKPLVNFAEYCSQSELQEKVWEKDGANFNHDLVTSCFPQIFSPNDKHHFFTK